jgi:hypothetical protein
MLVDLSKYELIRFRALKRVYRLHKVNKLELALLLQLVGYLNSENKTVISVNRFLQSLSGNPNERKRAGTYLFHCQNKKLLGSYEFIRHPGSKCIGLSSFGCEVVKCYLNQVNELLATVNLQPIAFFIPEVILSDLPLYRQAA